VFNQLVVSGLTIGSIYALIALGFSITFTSTKILNFAHGEMAMLGALLGVTFFSVLQLPYLVAMALIMVVVGTIAVLFERLVLHPIMLRGGHTHNLIISTLAAAFFISNVAELLWGKDDLYAKPSFGNEPIAFLGANFIPQSFLVFGVTIVFLLATWFFYERTTAGRSFRAVAIKPEAASLMSINVNRVMMLTLGLSGVLAAVSGFVFSPITNANAFIGMPLGVKGFAAALIGGLSSSRGSVAGGFVLGFFETFCSGYISSGYKDALAFTALLLVLFLKPAGLFVSSREFSE
jgi:branched-chain amino acid transport system permease protein